MAIERGVKLKVEILPDAGKMQDGLRSLKDSLVKSDSQVRNIGVEWDKIFRDPKTPRVNGVKREGIADAETPLGQSSGGKSGDALSEFARGVGGPLNTIAAIYEKLKGGIQGLGEVFSKATKPGVSGFVVAPAQQSAPPAPTGGSSGFRASTGPNLSKSGGSGSMPTGDISAGGEAAEGAEAGAGAGGEGLMAALGPIGMIAGAALLAGAALKGLADQSFHLAALANPATTDRFQLAMADAGAVVGERFLPVVEMATNIVRGFGDFLANALPSVADVSSTLDELRPAIEEIKEAFLDVAPILKDVGRQILTDFAAGLKIVGSTIKEVVKGFRSIFGDSMFAKDREGQTSMGASAQQARVGGIDAIGQSILEAALGQGRGDQSNPQEKMNTTLDNILKLLTESSKDFEPFALTVKDAMKWLQEGGLGKDIADKMKQIRNFGRG